MKKSIFLLLVFISSLGFSQINDDLRTAAKKKKVSTNTSSGGNSGSSGSSGGSYGGVSSSDISVLIDACGCLYNTAIPFFSEVVVKGIQKNTRFIKETKDSLPRIKNLEFSLGYGAFPEKEVVYMPKLRLQAGYIGTSFRSFVIQDKVNPFLTDLIAFYSWQVLEYNYVNSKHFTMRSGLGAVYNHYANLMSTEVGTSADFFFSDDKFRVNIEGRITPFGLRDGRRALFGDQMFRREVQARFYLRPSDRPKLHPEIFGGAYIANYFNSSTIWKLEAGIGFLLY